jgi:hypothetical protein
MNREALGGAEATLFHGIADMGKGWNQLRITAKWIGPGGPVGLWAYKNSLRDVGIALPGPWQLRGNLEKQLANY